MCLVEAQNIQNLQKQSQEMAWPSILTYLHLLNKLSTSTIFRPLAAIISEIPTVFPFSYSKAYNTKFDLPVKWVKVTQGSSPSFVKIGLPVPMKIFFSRFYTIYGHGGHLGNVTSII